MKVWWDTRKFFHAQEKVQGCIYAELASLPELLTMSQRRSSVPGRIWPRRSLLGSSASTQQPKSTRAFDFKIRTLPLPVTDEACSAAAGGLLGADRVGGAQAALLGPDALSMATVPHRG